MKSRSACCCRIRVRGIVQGVGFRPFVWRLAHELNIAGWVRNDADGVEIEAHGEDSAVATLLERLRREAPPLARVDEVSARAVDAEPCTGFAVIASDGGGGRTAIGPDTAVCPDCLTEILDPAHRRYRYAFTTCTHCGPRYTIARQLPYDRARTSLAPFPLCPACAGEYGDPADRRFHAEATCCPACGPRLRLVSGSATDNCSTTPDDDPVAAAWRLIAAGAIVAVKGLGGFHLACNARDAAAVARLRERKQREEKPFAVMAANVAALAALTTIDGGEAQLLESPERPIVLLRKQATADAELPGIAPGIAWLGAMLPATPLQYLLLHEAAGRPDGNAWLHQAQPTLLVMTSANPHGEPLVIGDDEAQERLVGIADALLLHDRDIVARCDDSVIRAAADGFQFIRRGRGFTPMAIRLPRPGPSVLAFGGWYKNTICITRGAEAFVSTHIGDLDNAASCDFLDEAVERMLALTEVEPDVVACDRHPDFHSSRAAAAFAADRGLALVSVQHHHAHIAAVCAEHGIDRPLIGLALDGVGLGDDGAAWGGELLHVDAAVYRRLGHLAPLALPGGDRAAREPWRMAAAVLAGLGRGDEIPTRFATQPGAATIAAMLARGLNCPPTSSLGRAFDAAAGLLGVRATMAYEGQAAMLLEGRAEIYGRVPPLAGGWSIRDGVLDLAPLFANLADRPAAPATAATTHADQGAALFHATLAAALAEWAIAAAGAAGIDTIACAGGCLLNRLLADGLRERFAAAGIRMLEAQRVPPNDGGLALGQAWIAANGASGSPGASPQTMKIDETDGR